MALLHVKGERTHDGTNLEPMFTTSLPKQEHFGGEATGYEK